MSSMSIWTPCPVTRAPRRHRHHRRRARYPTGRPCRPRSPRPTPSWPPRRARAGGPVRCAAPTSKAPRERRPGPLSEEQLRAECAANLAEFDSSRQDFAAWQALDGAARTAELARVRIGSRTPAGQEPTVGQVVVVHGCEQGWVTDPADCSGYRQADLLRHQWISIGGRGGGRVTGVDPGWWPGWGCRWSGWPAVVGVAGRGGGAGAGVGEGGWSAVEVFDQVAGGAAAVAVGQGGGAAFADGDGVVGVADGCSAPWGSAELVAGRRGIGGRRVGSRGGGRRW